MEAIATRLEVIAIGLEAVTSRSSLRQVSHYLRFSTKDLWLGHRKLRLAGRLELIWINDDFLVLEIYIYILKKLE